MRLESMLAEGTKFGARMFVLLQSMSLMRKIPEMDTVVEALLANTSTQAFFSPGPDDAQTVRDAISSVMRYGNITPDLPTLECWLRARVGGKWQQPVTVKISPLKRPDPDAVQKLIREVIVAHPNDYVLPGRWKNDAVQVLKEMLPPGAAEMLNIDYNPSKKKNTADTERIESSQLQEQIDAIKQMRNTGL
jgi:hypothetical protein